MTDENRNGTAENERFDEWLRALASDTNTPPATPRDAMWAGIEARRAASAASAAPAVRPIASAPSRRRWAWPAAVAAALLLGVALDRTLLAPAGDAGPASRVATSIDSSTVGATTHAAANTVADRDAPAGAERTVASGGSTAGSPKPSSSTSERAGGLPEPAMQVAASDGPRTTRPTTPVSERAAAEPTALYQLAAVQTLAQAEVLLTSWRSRDRESVDSASMHRLGTWARDVLGSTRLLLDSPAAEEPQLQRLLGDLELVLVQLVQLTGGTLTDEDRMLIDRALGERDLLPRLRNAVPAGTRTTAS